MKTETKAQTTVAARIAGEDIKTADFVTILNEIVELPSFLWSCSGSPLPMDEPVCTRFTPREAGLPLKVIAVCLPFIYARRASGGLATLDTRRQQLVRLEPEIGRVVWTRLRKGSKKR